jgi:hypothetical protein
MGVVGPDVLDSAVRTLGPGMRAPHDAIDGLVRQFARFVDNRDTIRRVVGLCAAYDPDPTAEARATEFLDRLEKKRFPFDFGADGQPPGAIVIAEMAKTFGTQIVAKAVTTMRDILHPPSVIAASESTAAAAAQARDTPPADTAPSGAG